MDIFIPYLFLLLLLPFSLYLIFFFRKEGSKDLPPGSRGWPILGENVDLALVGLSKFVRDRMEKYSPDIFQTSLLGARVMVFCGAQGNKLIFTNDGKLVTPWLPISLEKILLPEFKDSYHEARAVFRIIQYDTLKPEALKLYIPVMDEMARGQVRDFWEPHAGAGLKARQLINNYTFDLSCRLFMNVVDQESLKKLSGPFARMRNGMLSLPIDLPGTAFNRGIKAARRMRAEMAKVVAARRKEMAAEGKDVKDVLSKILVWTDEEGEHMSDYKIASFFMSLLVASHDSTASAIVSVVYFLAEFPHVYQEVLKGENPIRIIYRLFY